MLYGCLHRDDVKCEALPMLPCQKILYAASTFGHLKSFHVPYLSLLAKRGAQVCVVASGDPQGLPEGMESLCVSFTKSFTSPCNLKAMHELERLLRARRFDLVLTHTSLAAFFTRLAVKAAAAAAPSLPTPRVVNTVHGYLFDENTLLPKRSILLTAEKMVAGVTDRVITMNAQDTEIATRYALSAGDVVCVPGMGVDLRDCHMPTVSERIESKKGARYAPRRVGVVVRGGVLGTKEPSDAHTIAGKSAF